MPFDLFPSFWDKLKGEIQSGHIFTSVKVRSEINRGNENDELVNWTSQLPESFFVDIDGSIMMSYAQTINWANQNDQYFRLNVKFRLFCIFCITGTKQAERALWRSSRSLL